MTSTPQDNLQLLLGASAAQASAPTRADADTQTDYRPGVQLDGLSIIADEMGWTPTDLFRFTYVKSRAFRTRSHELARMDGLRRDEKLELITKLMARVLTSLTLPATAPSAPRAVSIAPIHIANPPPKSAQAQLAQPFAPAAISAVSLTSSRWVACSKKEGRCAGAYVVMPNGRFHGSHDNTGCAGVPVTVADAHKRKRKRARAASE